MALPSANEQWLSNVEQRTKALTINTTLPQSNHVFEIYQTPNNSQFYFRLKARNAQVILASEGYKTKASCKAGIRSVAKNAANTDRFALKTASNDKHYFVLEAKNGEVVGSSQMYASASGAKKGIASVQKNAVDSETKDLTA